MTNTQQFIIAIISLVVPLILGLGALYVQIRNYHKAVNSQLTALIEQIRAGAHAQGELKGQQDEHNKRAGL